MSTQAAGNVPSDIMPQLARLKPYLFVLLRKGRNYEQPDTLKIIQSEHLPYVFSWREKGAIAVTMPIRDETNIAAIAIFNITDKDEAKKIMENDPAVIKGIFTYELLNAIGMKGDTLD